jgi:hypothetical protein
MTRLGMVAAAAATLAAVVLAPTVGQAQSVDAAARDLRTHDVTFESGAVTDQDLADLDRVTAQLQADGDYTKVVVLAHPVDTSSGARAFAGKVLDTLGGRGRVIVFDPRDVGIATNVPDEASKVNSAELAAIDAANRSNSFAQGLGAAAGTGASSSASGTAGTGSGSRWQRRRPGPRAGRLDREHLPPRARGPLGLVGVGFARSSPGKARRHGLQAPGRGQQTVRARGRGGVEPGHRPGRSDRVPVHRPRRSPRSVTAPPSSPPCRTTSRAADNARAGGGVPRLVHARWSWVLESPPHGQPAHAEPTPGPLFPPPPPPPPGAAPVPSAPEPHYQRHTQHSPWLTDAAITAISVLASRGLASARSSPRRQPSDDVWFRDRYGGPAGGGSRGGERQSGSQSRPPISMGGQRGRGMGDR